MYDEHLSERIRQKLKEKHVAFEEKKMMGGLCIMIDGKMCVGVLKDMLMARIDPEIFEKAIKKKGCRPMEFTGRVSKGFILVEPKGVDMEKDFDYWIQLSLDFNPKAKASKRK